MLNHLPVNERSEENVVSVSAEPAEAVIQRARSRSAGTAKKAQPEVYVIEDITKKFGRGKGATYEVVWEGGETTHEPHSNLRHLLHQSCWSFKGKPSRAKRRKLN